MDKSHKLDLYEVDLKYIRDLQKVDDNVMSSSPQIGKGTRKYIGIVTVLDNKEYCIPLSSGNKDKFQKKSKMDLIKILDDSIKNEKGAPKVIAVLNINNMIPVHSSVITKVNIELPNNKKSPEWHYKRLQIKEVEWCRNNVETILNRASKVYNLIINEPDKNKALTKRCCDFKKLEDVLQKRLQKTGITLPDTKAQENKQSAHAKPPKNGNIKQIKNDVSETEEISDKVSVPNEMSALIEAREAFAEGSISQEEYRQAVKDFMHTLQGKEMWIEAAGTLRSQLDNCPEEMKKYIGYELKNLEINIDKKFAPKRQQTFDELSKAAKEKYIKLQKEKEAVGAVSNRNDKNRNER